MKKPTIIITAADHDKLSRMIALIPPREREEVRGLEAELNRAKIVAPEDVPADVITMNSRAELLDLDTRERLELTVVFPAEADIEQRKISVLAPVGTGMLGYRVGDVFEQPAPDGPRTFMVVLVHFQPEAAVLGKSA